MTNTRRVLVCLAAGLLAGTAHAQLITNGFTYAVASSYDSTGWGEHFHSDTGGSYGNPAGKAEVGRYSTEEVRGLSEYNLAGLAASSSAFVTFNVFKAGGLFAGQNDTPFDGHISVYAYLGNNTEDINDYQAPETNFIGSFATSGLIVGGILSFDITSVYDTFVGNGYDSLGIRLQADPLNESGAWTFDNFRLTVDNQTTDGAVPEPSTYGMFACATLLGLVAWRRRKA